MSMEQMSVTTNLLGESAAMRRVRDEIRVFGAVDAPVLIEGETGTGKTLVARAIHAASRRRDGPFVSLMNVRSADALLVSPPHAEAGRRASRAALRERISVFEAALGGTLLLDEIGDMPVRTQAALLRVLEAPAIRGAQGVAHADAARALDVRLLATTHRHLDREVAEGRFRQDLFYRLRVARLVVPPLRQRPEDIPVLALAFLRRAAAAYGRDVDAIGREALERLAAYGWPGNVRELASTIDAAVIRAAGRALGAADLLPDLAHEDVPKVRQAPTLERVRVAEALRRADGNRSVAARLLGVSRATLYRRLARLDPGEGD
jgi:DNA-binding NtrC family response regulator